MQTSTAFEVAAWVLIIPLGGIMLQSVCQAHRDIDHDLGDDARAPMLRTIGYSLLTLAFVSTMFGLRWFFPPLVVPAITGCTVSTLALWLVYQARQRIQKNE